MPTYNRCSEQICGMNEQTTKNNNNHKKSKIKKKSARRKILPQIKQLKANDPVSLHYCPDYIIPLDKAIEDMEKDLEETKDDHGLEDYRKEVAENLEKCKKAKIEGVQC